MSDLAPFIVATIRDKVVDDLLQEVDSLRKRLRFHQTVEITGPSGVPVYTRGHFHDGKYEAYGDRWIVSFNDARIGVVPCRFDELIDVEIRVGGICIGSFDCTYDICCDDKHDNEGRKGNIYLESGDLFLEVMIETLSGNHRTKYMNKNTNISALEERVIYFGNVAFYLPTFKGVIDTLPFKKEETIGRESRDDS